MTWRRAGIALMSVVVLHGVAVRGAGFTNAIEIGVKGRANANASLATDGTFVAIAWAARTTEGVTDIYSAISRDSGRSFSGPVRVNQIAGDANVSGEQPPRVALVPRRGNDPAMIVVWTAKASTGTRLVFGRSDDGGRSFGPARAVAGSDASGNRGWESIAIGPKGDVIALWLDHREVPARTADAAKTNGAHQHGASGQHQMDGAARAQLSQLFFADLDDSRSVRSIAKGVCYCCKTSVAAGADGGVFAAWRHVYEGNVRDIALARSSDGGRTFAPPVRVSEDNWVLNGCPENGPSLAVDQANVVHIAWPTLVHDSAATEPALALFHAMSMDGQRFTPRQRIPTEGMPRHAQIAIRSTGQIIVAWDEPLKGARRVALATGAVNGTNAVRFRRESIGDERGSYPVVAALQDGAIVAWTAGTTGQTVLRVLRLPAKG